MTNQNFSQRNKSFRKLFLKSNITFSNNPINRLIGVQPENDKNSRIVNTTMPKVSFSLWMHYKERYRSSNTGKILLLSDN